MNLSPLTPRELPDLREFFARLPLDLPPENLEQFCAPRALRGGIEVATLVMREAGSIVGTIGWIDVPLRLNDGLGRGLDGGRHEKVRWPVNLYLLAGQRGKGLGRQLMEATREGATLRAVIGGNNLSIPVLEKTGYREAGRLVCARWARPCVAAATWRDRFGGGARSPGRRDTSWLLGRSLVRARLARGWTGWLPWADRTARGAPNEAGVPHDARYLEFAFGSAMAPYHASYSVDVNGALAGFFVLAPRAGQRFRLAVEVVDLDAVPGREAEVLDAARRIALGCADVARLRIAGARFTSVLARTTRGIAQDHALRISCDDPDEALRADWRLTYGDHDQYRVRAGSLKWR